MQLIVDANVLLAGILKDALTRELLLDTRLKLHAPEHLILETLHLLKRNTKLQKRVGLPLKILEEKFYLLTREIETYSRQAYAPFIKEAVKLAPHKEDAPYLALALAFNIPIWSNDKGIGHQTTVKVYTTKNLLDVLEKRSL